MARFDGRTSILMIALAAMIAFVVAPSDATIYAYTDAQGRIRITDIPEDGSKVVVLPRLSDEKPAAPAAAVRTSATYNTRTSSTTRSASPRRDPSVYKHLVKEASDAYSVSESLLFAVMRAESNFNPYALSPAGARGLMQLIPSTARLVGVTDIFDPRQNILGGAKYLRMMLDRFGRIDLALAAYNAGPEAVQRYGGIPPYSETLNYVPRVLKYYREFGGSGELNLSIPTTPLRTASSAATRTRAGSRRSSATPTVSAGDVPVISRVNNPIFYYRGPDGQIYISNVK